LSSNASYKTTLARDYRTTTNFDLVPPPSVNSGLDSTFNLQRFVFTFNKIFSTRCTRPDSLLSKSEMTKNVSFISNTGSTHKSFLLDCFKKADKVIIGVGFLRQSGLNNIKEHLTELCSDNSKSIEFYIGTGLGETDPDALMSLFGIIKSNLKNKLILCTPDAGIFHPKIYIFIAGSNVIIVTGSSNLTQHGWEVNDEVSMVTETSIKSVEYLQLEKYIQKLYAKYFTPNIETLLQRYKKEKEDYQAAFAKPPAFKFRRTSTTITGIDMPRLKRYYELYEKSNDFINPIERERQYQNARNNLEELASSKPLTSNQFHSLFGPLVGHKDYKPKLWHSGSIHRTTHKTLGYPDSFREIVRSVKANLAMPINIAFRNVTELVSKMRKEKTISGVGPNIVTEIFLSYNPKKFANLNDNPIAVLSLVGKDFDTTRFTGNDYAQYVELLKKIRDELKMDTFLEIDSFFNYVYWNLTEEG
jgi:HKD family nuclease